MNYFVVLPDGRRFGPADLTLLNAWAREGRLIPASVLEEEGTGRRLSAYELAGLQFPTSGMSPPSSWGSGTPGPQPGAPGPAPGSTPWVQQPGTGPQPGTGQGPFARPGQSPGPGQGPSPYQGYYRSPYGPQNSSNLTTAWILGAVSLFSLLLCCCSSGVLAIVGIICGGIGMNCANKAKRDGFSAAQSAYVLNLVGLILCCIGLVGGIILMAIGSAGGFASGFGQ